MPDRLTTSQLTALLAGVRPAADERDQPSAETLERIMRSRAPQRPRRLAGRRRAALAAAVVALSASGVAVAADVVLQPPKPDTTVPAVPEWTYVADFYGTGPVLARHKAEWLRTANRRQEAVLGERGIEHPRCGIDRSYPLACFLPDGNLVSDRGVPVIPDQFLAPETTDIRRLSPTEAHRWLCEHPEQRPGADLGEKPAPTEGYEDCPQR